jgi:hypothetical protein
VVVLAVLLQSSAWCIPYMGVSCIDHNSNRTGAITHNSTRSNSGSNSSSSNSNSSTIPLLHHHSRLPSGRHSSFRQQLSMLQLRENGPLCSRIPFAQAKQLAASSGTSGQSVGGPSEGSCTSGNSHQLHHHRGDSHGRRSDSGYVLPQRHPVIILFDSGVRMIS